MSVIIDEHTDAMSLSEHANHHSHIPPTEGSRWLFAFFFIIAFH